MKYNRLTPIKQVSINKYYTKIWLFKCDCGEEVIAQLPAVRFGKTKSCGCYKQEQRVKHGYSKIGKEKNRVYYTWLSIKDRCYNKKCSAYKNYGGRGIQVCERWYELENFMQDMQSTWKRGLSIDRIDVDRNYQPENCRWATAKQQANNRRIKI